MPAWLLFPLSKLVLFALQMGIPIAQKMFPRVPAQVWVVIEGILKMLQGSPNPQLLQARSEVVVSKMLEAHSHCEGMVACPSDVKKE